MYLRSLEIAGFKSFSSRAKLDLSPGIIGIVGPNGAGKSNLSDALRWVLGAQSPKLLRTTKSEEVIFSGSQKKAKASLAEVTIVLDNSDHAMPIEFSQVQITRRLYRSGESEYLLGGHKVRLLDVAEILAQSGFGQNSYSVVAQGMIDSLLMATPQTRKSMFDEATGIRTFELRRDQTNKKLTAAKENLNVTENLIAELVPKRDALRSKSEALDRKAKLEQELIKLRQSYVDMRSQLLSDQKLDISIKLDEKKAEALILGDKIKSLHQSQKKREFNQINQQSQLDKLRQKLSRAESQRDGHHEQLAKALAELKLIQSSIQSETELDRSEESKIKQIQALEKKLRTIEGRYASVEKKNLENEEKIAVYDTKLTSLNDELASLRRRFNKNQKSDYVLHALGLISMLRRELKRDKLDRETFGLMLHKLSRVVKLASEENPAELLGNISKQQKLITREMSRREEILETQTTDIIKMRALELDISYIERELTSLRQNQTVHDKKNHQPDLNKQLSDKQKIVSDLKNKIRIDDELIEKLRSQIITPPTVENTSADQSFLAELESASRAQATADERIKQLQHDLAEIMQAQKQLLQLAAKWRIEASQFSGGDAISLDDVHRLEGELAQLQQVDPSSPDEYRQINEKLEFLKSQHADLGAAIVDMEKIARNLDQMILEKFERSFAKINRKFSYYFEQLFDGGTAELHLQKDDQGEYGIEIVAHPPGKKVELLSSLSGGEKALASMALLAAILSVNPSPFVVLDEVDAALDDINSIKFNKILKELARRSQLIIITHNHQTMQQASELIGVAPHLGGDSKLLHVRLTEAHQLVQT